MFEDIHLPSLNSAKIISIVWHAKQGEYIEKNSLLCSLDLENSGSDLLNFIMNEKNSTSTRRDIYSPINGIINLINSKRQVELTKVLCSIKKIREISCTHEIEYGGICVMCGEEIENFSLPQKLSCAVNGRNLKFSETLANSLEETKKQSLLRDKKLILVLDLDHTLIHTVQGLINDPDVHHFDIDGNVFSTKLRPFLSEFLERLSGLYEFCVYTMGSHKYADQIVELVDPQQKYFSNRVISKDQSDSKDKKSLKILLPSSDSMAVILDDTNEVWPDSENLVLADKFLYFYDIVPYNEKFAGNNDWYLHYIAELFEKLHERFYARPNMDVKEILRGLQKEVLDGCKIVLSGIISQEEAPDSNFFWKIIQKFGGTCQRDLTPDTTHVISKAIGTKKTKIASKMGIQVLSLIWLHLSTSYWVHLPEHYFTFDNIGSFDMSSLVNFLKLKKSDVLKKNKTKESPDSEISESDESESSD